MLDQVASVKSIFPDLGRRTLLMGIVNASPDSFSSDGISRPDVAIRQAEEFIRLGADIIDIGGESTRPGHTPISQAIEWERVAPVLEPLTKKHSSKVIFSLDTTKPELCASGITSGVNIINCVTIPDGELLRALAATSAIVIITDDTKVPSGAGNVMQIVYDSLANGVDRLNRAGIDSGRIIIDPGIGFGKRGALNVALLKDLSRLKELGVPILLGPSRKSFLGEITGREAPDRDAATASVIALSIAAGVDIVRVHNVAMMKDVVAVADRIVRGDGDK